MVAISRRQQEGRNSGGSSRTNCPVNDVLSVLSCHVETVVLLSKLNTKQHIEVELNLDELDLTSAESKATYDEGSVKNFSQNGLQGLA